MEDPNEFDIDADISTPPEISDKLEYNDFKEVCWDLKERGAVGETILHLCLLNATCTHADLAKRLLKFYPKLINDIYISDEYYGENVLHWAIVNEDPSMVKFLLDSGANYHERCIGNFMCPEDQKPSRSDSLHHEFVNVQPDTNYEGYVYWGEYPLSIAACLGQEECYRLMLARGADPNNRDTNGNTVLHMMIIYQKLESFDMAYEAGADLEIKNCKNLTPLTLAAKLARIEMFLHILNIEREIYWQIGNVTCAAYPLSQIDTIDHITGNISNNSALNLVVFGDKDEHLELMDGVLIDLLNEKWNTFVKFKFYKQFLQFSLYFLISVICFTLRPGPLIVAENAASVVTADLINSESNKSIANDSRHLFQIEISAISKDMFYYKNHSESKDGSNENIHQSDKYYNQHDTTLSNMDKNQNQNKRIKTTNNDDRNILEIFNNQNESIRTSDQHNVSRVNDRSNDSNDNYHQNDSIHISGLYYESQINSSVNDSSENYNQNKSSQNNHSHVRIERIDKNDSNHMPNQNVSTSAKIYFHSNSIDHVPDTNYENNRSIKNKRTKLNSQITDVVYNNTKVPIEVNNMGELFLNGIENYTDVQGSTPDEITNFSSNQIDVAENIITSLKQNSSDSSTAFHLVSTTSINDTIKNNITDSSKSPTRTNENWWSLKNIGKCRLLIIRGYADIIRITLEIGLEISALLYLLAAVREAGFLGLGMFVENLMTAPSKVMFLFSCLLMMSLPILRLTCLDQFEDIISVCIMLTTSPYFLFYCSCCFFPVTIERGFKTVGPFVVMIYRMVMGDLLRFVMIYLVFVMGFSQAYYVIFLSFDNPNTPDGVDDSVSNPMPNPVESVMAMFLMSLNMFGDYYTAFDKTNHGDVAKLCFVIYMVIVAILLVNMLIAMMGNTYQKIAETRNEWQRQWARIVLVVERGVSPDERLKKLMFYSQPMSDGRRALVLRLNQSNEDKEEMKAILEMKRNHYRNAQKQKTRNENSCVPSYNLNKHAT